MRDRNRGEALSRKKILVTGASGFVAGSVLYFGAEEYEIHAISRGRSLYEHENVHWHTLGIEDHVGLSVLFEGLRPDAIIHTAAFADIDYCEQNRSIANEVNVDYTERLAELARQHQVRMVYVSTDNVFDGFCELYTESSSAEPINYYGHTKLEAEKIVLNTVPDSIVCRLALVMGFPVIGGGNSFLARIVAKWDDGESVGVPDNEMRSPIDVVTAGRALLELATTETRGVILLGGLDRLRRFDLVRRLAEGLGYDPGLVHVFDPINLDGRADRPESVLFDMSYAQNVLETRIVSLDDAIAQIEPFKPRG